MAFQFQSIAALSPFLQQGAGLGLAEIGLLIGLYLAPGVLVAVPGGAMAAWSVSARAEPSVFRERLSLGQRHTAQTKAAHPEDQRLGLGRRILHGQASLANIRDAIARAVGCFGLRRLRDVDTQTVRRR